VAIHLNTAKTRGVSIPPMLLARAYERSKSSALVLGCVSPLLADVPRSDSFVR
jgi:hypothetical protein